MRELRNPHHTFAKIALIIGASLSGVGLILAVFGFIFNEAAFILNIQAAVWGFQGLMWLGMWIGMRSYFMSLANKFMRLKREGLCYDAEILQIVPSRTHQIGRSYGAYAECRYKNQEDKTCLVRSKLFLIDYGYHDKDNYAAKVYVSRRDPHDYFVDIQLSGQANMQADYDYR